MAHVTAGLDLLTENERHADRLAAVCAEVLAGRGGTDVSITTHAATFGELRHVALVVEAAGLDEPAVREALLEVLEPIRTSGVTGGLLLGGAFTGDLALEPVVAELLSRHAERTAGRVAVFPGQAGVPSSTSVDELVARTAIDEVHVIGGAEPPAEAALVTRDFLRPRWVAGRLVLHTQPAAGGVLVPFETPDPTPCCAAHG